MPSALAPPATLTSCLGRILSLPLLLLWHRGAPRAAKPACWPTAAAVALVGPRASWCLWWHGEHGSGFGVPHGTPARAALTLSHSPCSRAGLAPCVLHGGAGSTAGMQNEMRCDSPSSWEHRCNLHQNVLSRLESPGWSSVPGQDQPPLAPDVAPGGARPWRCPAALRCPGHRPAALPAPSSRDRARPAPCTPKSRRGIARLNKHGAPSPPGLLLPQAPCRDPRVPGALPALQGGWGLMDGPTGLFWVSLRRSLPRTPPGDAGGLAVTGRGHQLCLQGWAAGAAPVPLHCSAWHPVTASGTSWPGSLGTVPAELLGLWLQSLLTHTV